MHFEASDQLIRSWHQAGRLTDQPAGAAPAFAEFGDRGSEVLAVQRRLALAISGEIDADGIFGAMTRAAVMEFQRRGRMAVTGVVDDATWAALRAATPEIA